MIVDLHTHTTASDGALPPDELVQLAIANGVQMLSITDHDTVSGYLSVKDGVTDMRLIAGVEVSTTWEGIGIHIVGLNFDASHPAITDLLANQASSRQKRYHSILHKLTKADMPITAAELIASVGHDHIGRPHIAKVMVEKGYVSGVDKAFKKYLGAGKMGDVKNQWSSLAETVAAINASGGIAIIAHPNQYKMTRSKLLRMVNEFVDMGGQGIEVISGHQHADITTKYAHIANDNGLYASIGSDFHRYFPHAPSVGQLCQLPDMVTPIWQAF